MKIAIGTCEKTSCSTMGCFRAYNNKDKHFAQYKDVETDLVSFFRCNICSKETKEKVEEVAQRLKNEGVERVHLGVCAVKCKADNLSEIKEIFESIDIDVIEGTH